MWYLWRAGPNDRVGQYVSSFPSLDAVRRVVDDFADGEKVVVRQVSDGVQLIIKSHATTLESITRAVTYYAKKDRVTPVIRELDIRIGKDGRKVGPGGRLPSPYLDIDPHKGM